MGHTAAIRFLEPVDPRIIWEAARVAVCAPVGWTHHGLPDCYPPQYITNLLWQSDPCGATALVTMSYRPEGAMLDDSEWEAGEPGRPPAAYVELDLDTRWQHADNNLEAAYAVIKAVGARAAINEYVGNSEWIEVAR